MLTIAVVTKDRSDFLLRLLKYYADTGYKHWICIGDSSTGLHLEQGKKAVKTFEGKLKIKYHECPGLNIPATVKSLLPSITTPYVACVSDGGFLVPGSLDKCVWFLEAHPDYSIAHGLGALFILKQEAPYGEFLSIGKYNSLPKVEEEKASARLIRHLDNYSVTIYCVYRASVWKKIWREADLMPDASFAGETLPCCLAVVYGKAKELDCLYLVRQLHNRRNVVGMPDTYDTFTSLEWQQSYQIFHDALVNALIEQDGIDRNEAHEVVKRAFWSCLKTHLAIKFQKQYFISTRERIKHKLKDIPGLVTCVRAIRSLVFSSKSISLPALLSRHSPYHNDFMPIYKTVTSLPTEFGIFNKGREDVKR